MEIAEQLLEYEKADQPWRKETFATPQNDDQDDVQKVFYYFSATIAYHLATPQFCVEEVIVPIM